ncbi:MULTISPECIES: septal ring lytic transglycosylase RlpA family protein [Pseudoalteromonas]|uniref:septal ring lytic transglycosylase RlpA family protein n=1 Tax=Pseudoalteromonas TaxID=53246 RepID=UPI002097456A|nr:septal ring lytic transglycosylase RlpA family protein [Pseudoalteromonas sp. OANN1]MCO7199324.1 septal ring lytic transglycosylase RlpA family protein [Pseudoalteromonas sp. OANN1]
MTVRITLISKLVLVLALLSVLSACGSRYHIRHDKAPLREPTELEMQDAIVTNEKKSVSANRPYTVLGKRYTPISDEHGYQQQGIASWYGRKFHGYHTSNGEIFNMFDMTAAHKTLPLPSFAKVTNLDNGRSAIVRINDRGPFHDDRLIDLSYAAAYKLGYHLQGTARVKVEAITLSRESPRLTYVQVAAGSKLENIQLLAGQLKQEFGLGTPITFENNLYKLRVGPITDDNQAQSLLKTLQQGQFSRAFLLYSEQEL